MTLFFDTRCWALFTLTVLSAAYWPMLPSWPWALLLCATIILILKFRRFRVGLGVFLALVVVIVHGNLLHWQAESLYRAGMHSTINAIVNSPFIPITHGYEGIITISRINGEPIASHWPVKVRAISAHSYQIGDQLFAHVSISPNYGLRNRVGFDRERHLFSQGILAKVKIDSHLPKRVISRGSLRQRLIDSVATQAESATHFALIKALVFGLRDELTPSDWQQLRVTGLTHLLSISGLHIGMAFGFGAALGFALRFLWLSGVWSSGVWLPMLCGLFASASYAWLADFSIPTSRALLFCSLAVMSTLCRVSASRWHLLLWTLGINLAFEPFAPLSSSFWLSYGAVAAVMLALPTARGRSNKAISNKASRSVAPNSTILMWRERAVQLLLMQLKLTLFLLPLSLYYFQGVSVVSLLFNLVFIPWFSVLVIPALFIALLMTLLLPDAAPIGWTGVDALLQPLAWAMQWVEVGWGWWPYNGLEESMLFMGLVLLWSWFQWPLRSGLLILSLGWTLFARHDDALRLEVFDVGHGLGLALTRNDHAVIYDTGAAWGEGSIAQMVISPNLRELGVAHLDGLVLSHGDNDHAGGRDTIEAQWSPHWVRSGESEQTDLPCVRGETWFWQQTHWQVLWPPTSVKRVYNPQSCVIRVTDLNSGKKLLLTGDVTTLVEWLLIRQPDSLQADVMIVPHHGSTTSSLAEFIAAVSADIAIASTAKGNQWGLPKQEIVQRYTQQGTQWMDTGTSGQISLRFTPQGVEVTTQRRETFEPWYRQMMRNQVE